MDGTTYEGLFASGSYGDSGVLTLPDGTKN